MNIAIPTNIKISNDGKLLLDNLTKLDRLLKKVTPIIIIIKNIISKKAAHSIIDLPIRQKYFSTPAEKISKDVFPVFTANDNIVPAPERKIKLSKSIIIEIPLLNK